MKISYRRTAKNDLYTEGEIWINGKKVIPYCVENAEDMLPDGEYKVVMGVDVNRCLYVVPSEVMPYVKGDMVKRVSKAVIVPGNSWRDNGGKNAIRVGDILIPGALKNSRKLFLRLWERLKKAKSREEITLSVEGNMRSSQPLEFWNSPKDHGCPITAISVVDEGKGYVVVYNGEEEMKRVYYDKE